MSTSNCCFWTSRRADTCSQLWWEEKRKNRAMQDANPRPLTSVEGRQDAFWAHFLAVENRRPPPPSTTSRYTVYINASGRIQPGSPEHYTTAYTVARVPLLQQSVYRLHALGRMVPRGLRSRRARVSHREPL